MNRGIKVFVYGTLLKGQSNHRLLHRALAGPVAAEVWGYALYQVTPAYPGAVPDEAGKIKGEIYWVDEELLRELDELEDYDPDTHSGLYIRQKTRTVDQQEVYIYVWTGPVRQEWEVPYEQQPWHSDWAGDQNPGTGN
ncbi:MAG: gamma-glutamylcyclotransferase family protein [Bacillota bacterium]